MLQIPELCSLSECPQRDCAPVAHSGNVLVNTQFIGHSLFPSYSYPLLARVSLR